MSTTNDESCVCFWKNMSNWGGINDRKGVEWKWVCIIVTKLYKYSLFAVRWVVSNWISLQYQRLEMGQKFNFFTYSIKYLFEISIATTYAGLQRQTSPTTWLLAQVTYGQAGTQPQGETICQIWPAGQTSVQSHAGLQPQTGAPTQVDARPQPGDSTVHGFGLAAN